MIYSPNRVEYAGEKGRIVVKEKDFRIYKGALEEAANHLFSAADEEIPNAVFPVWRDAIHAILMQHGCPCTHDVHGRCFADLTEEDQEKRLSDTGVSFEKFLKLLFEAKTAFLSRHAH